MFVGNGAGPYAARRHIVSQKTGSWISFAGSCIVTIAETAANELDLSQGGYFPEIVLRDATLTAMDGF
jgi:hypothetical protein